MAECKAAAKVMMNNVPQFRQDIKKIHLWYKHVTANLHISKSD